jgi:hypothetical protein
MNSFIRCCLLAGLFATTICTAGAPPVEEFDDEIIVEGKSLSQLRSDIVKAEDRFYEKYNRLNTDREYSMKCEDSASTGSKLTSRKCKPRMVETATSQQARDFLYAMQDNFLAFQGGGGVDASSGAQSAATQSAESSASAAQSVPDIGTAFARGGSADSMIDGERDGFRRNMLELIRKHPELQKLIQEHANAMARYEKARKLRRKPDAVAAPAGSASP